MINYEETPEFKKDLRRLSKRFRTLSQDLEVAKRNAIELFHIHRIDNRSVFLIPNFCSERIRVCKLRKFACKALKGRGSKSGVRIIYLFLEKAEKVIFLEMYFKGDKEKENFHRIKKCLKLLEK